MSNSSPLPPLSLDRLNAEIQRVRQCQAHLTDLASAEDDLRRHDLSSRHLSFDRVPLGRDGLPTPEHQARVREIRRQQAEERRYLIERRDALRAAIREQSEPLMRLAVRPEIGEPPSKLRNLVEAWTGVGYDYSHPPYLGEARHFLADIVLKLNNCREALEDPGGQSGGQGGEGRTTDSRNAPAPVRGKESKRHSKPDHPAVTDPVLSELEYDILDALYGLMARDPEKRQTTDAIAGKVGGKTTAASCKRPVAKLRRLGLLDTKEGPGGGCWLTPTGSALIKRVRNL